MQFLNQNVLFLLIPLIALIALVLTNKDSMQRYFPKEVLQRLIVSNNGINRLTRNGLIFFTLVLFIIAMARPVMNLQTKQIDQEVIPIVVALDVSMSMKAKDIYPNRIELAKKKLQQIIELSKNSAIGVILFAKDSYVLSPITYDFVSLKYIVDNIDTSLEFTNGSNYFAVLEGANTLLREYENKNLILLTDGGNDEEFANHVDFANSIGLSVYVIATATKEGSVIPKHNAQGYVTDQNGKIVNVKINESIKNLALQTNGGYIPFSFDSSDVDQIVNLIESNSKKDTLNTQQIKTYTELFYYPLGLGIFILFIALSSFPTLQKTTNLVVLMFGLFGVEHLKAFEFDFQKIEKANQYTKEQKYKEAQKEFEKLPNSPQGFYNIANTLYKQGKFEEAIANYEKVQTSDPSLKASSLYNIANSYVKLNNLEKAKEYYEKSLKIQQDQNTQENLDLVNKELEKRKEQQQEKNQNDQKNDSKEKNDQQNSQNSQNKDQQQNQQDSKEKNQQNKDDNKSKEQNKEQKQQDKNDEQNQSKNNSLNEQKQNSIEQNSSQMQQLQNQPISDMEEQKWLQMLQNKKTPLFLQKVPSSKGNYNDEKPW
ncbi:MAG: tetratricopeptide repeat protein [Campylobacterales bacterium]|nr:tetratricopeptide repeat protein [Campylobacterales bacterium]